MAKFVFAMQHHPSAAQVADLKAVFGGDRQVVALAATPDPTKGQGDAQPGVTYLGKAALLAVPDDPGLSRDWFVQRAADLVAATGLEAGDVVLAQGQAQLANALAAAARQIGASPVEATTKRVTVEQRQEDGSTKKVAVFEHCGYRTLFEF